MPEPTTIPTYASAPAATGRKSARQKRQPQVCTPRHLAVLLDARGFGEKLAQQELSALNELIAGCQRHGIPLLSIHVTCKSALLLNELRNWLREHAAASRDVHFQAFGELAVQHSAPGTQHPSLSVNVAVNYSGRVELARAISRVAKDVAAGKLRADQLTVEHLQASLETAALPPVDLLIHTAGVARLTDFLLWQAAYAELLFTNVPWADFSANDLAQALDDYACRRRTFGGLK